MSRAGHIASQCVNKRVMVINAQGELESENEEEVDDDDIDRKSVV